MGYPDTLTLLTSSTSTADDRLAAALVHAVIAELENCLETIEHCVRQLDQRQLNWRPDETQKCIGNLLLHLCGNLQQWIVSGLGGAADIRNRAGEFSERTMFTADELLTPLRVCVAEARATLLRLTAADMLEARRIQGFEMTGVSALLHATPHFRGHTQEIVSRTRQLLGDRYQFFWKPATREQGLA